MGGGGGALLAAGGEPAVAPQGVATANRVHVGIVAVALLALAAATREVRRRARAR